MSRTTRLTSLVVAFSVISMSTACQNRGVTPPPETLRRLMEARDVEGASEYMLNVLRESLGSSLPSIELTGPDKRVTSLSDLSGSKLALFGAMGPCPYTLKWSSELRERGWEVEGRRLLILRIKGLRHGGPLDLALKDAPSVYETPFPMPGYLNAIRQYPFMFYVSEDGRLEGFQLGMLRPAEFRDKTERTDKEVTEETDEIVDSPAEAGCLANSA